VGPTYSMVDFKKKKKILEVVQKLYRNCKRIISLLYIGSRMKIFLVELVRNFVLFNYPSKKKKR
jgi:hypothetical protein